MDLRTPRDSVRMEARVCQNAMKTPAKATTTATKEMRSAEEIVSKALTGVERFYISIQPKAIARTRFGPNFLVTAICTTPDRCAA